MVNHFVEEETMPLNRLYERRRHHVGTSFHSASEIRIGGRVYSLELNVRSNGGESDVGCLHVRSYPCEEVLNRVVRGC